MWCTLCVYIHNQFQEEEFSPCRTHLNAGVILVVTVCSDRYIISLFPHLNSPVPSKPYSFSGRDIKHHEKNASVESGGTIEYRDPSWGVTGDR